MPANKIIWMCWFQGEDDPKIPNINKRCIKKWRDLNSDWEIHVLTYQTIGEFVPEFFNIVRSSPPKSRAAKSDLLRILLLSKYGGVWVDASVYPMFPLSDYYDDIVNVTGFFTYRFMPRAKPSRETVSWFICADEKNHPLIEKWKTEFVNRFKSYKRWPYYTFHSTLSDLYDSDEYVRLIINNMVQIDAGIPHSFAKAESKHDSFMYKRPRNINKLEKL